MNKSKHRNTSKNKSVNKRRKSRAIKGGSFKQQFVKGMQLPDELNCVIYDIAVESRKVELATTLVEHGHVLILLKSLNHIHMVNALIPMHIHPCAMNNTLSIILDEDIMRTAYTNIEFKESDMFKDIKQQLHSVKTYKDRYKAMHIAATDIVNHGIVHIQLLRNDVNESLINVRSLDSIYDDIISLYNKNIYIIHGMNVYK